MAQGFSHVPVTHEHGDAPVSPDARKRLRRWGAIAAVGGFLFGYDTGVISGALLFIKHDFDLGSFEQGFVVSVLLLGAMLGALVASRPADRYGRKYTLAGIAIVYTLGIAAAAAAPSFGVLLGARFVMGLGVGAASAIVPLYLSEIAPSNVRGQLVSLNQLMITIGIVVSYLVDLIFASSEAWRAMFAIGAIPSLLFLLGMLRMPETPAWLDARGREKEARAVLGEVTDQDTVDEMISGYRKAREQAGARIKLRQLARSGARPALIIGLVLAVVQQFGGMIVTLILLGLTFALPLGAIDSYVALLCILLYIAAFAIGMGPVFWLLVSEVFPANARAEGVSVSGTANWLANFIIGLVFLPLIGAIGEGPTFWIFAAVSVLGLLFVQRYVPETKGRSFAEVDTDVHARFGAPRPAVAEGSAS